MQSQATYNYKVVRQFAVMTVIWGIVGMLVGVIIAAQLVWPELNVHEFLSYGRLRPLHTNAVIFAFGGCALFATSYYAVQRTSHAVLFAPGLAAFTFWGWQLVIVLAAISLPLGFTQAKEYAELEWPIDILITLVWVSYAVVFFGTIVKRTVSHIYVANWFYGGFILTVAVLHLVNSAAIPVFAAGILTPKSYSAYAGVQDAMIQWWYGHNAVGFFLTAGFLGMMYYFVPKQAGRPVYSYRLSVVHFWALIFTYMWAGPHHLHYTALPDWTQSVGMVFSLILLAPSWGGMINGIMTLSGAWHKLRDDPILKFMITSLSFYGMFDLRRPDDVDQDGQRPVALHRLDCRPRAFRCAGLGGDDFHRLDLLPAAASVRQARDAFEETDRSAFLDRHHRRRALHRFDVDCRRDAGPDVARDQRGWHADLLLRRIGQGNLPVLDHTPAGRPAVPLRHVHHGLEHVPDHGGWQGSQCAGARTRSSPLSPTEPNKEPYIMLTHDKIERNVGLLIVLTILTISVGGLLEIVPLFFQKSTTTPTNELVKPYSPLRLAGRDIYIREGCYNCHSQMIRPFRAETERYGHYSVAGEFVYDHPFQWGSKRTGPDLARVGGRYSDQWHKTHLLNPRDVVPESNMPAYYWLDRPLKDDAIDAKMKALRAVGVPYTDAEIAGAKKDIEGVTELDALVAYLQGMGTALKQTR